MPDFGTHSAALASTNTSSAVSMVGLAAIAQTLGIDLVALFYAFMGAACWRAIQPAIAPTFDEISRAFGWSILAMILGSLGAVVAAKWAYSVFAFLQGVDHAALLGLIATLFGFFCPPILLKGFEYIKNWRATNGT